jgi:hypothetical protein
MNATTIKTLTHEDIRDLLIGFAAAIELDQIRVDALKSFIGGTATACGGSGGAIILILSISCFQPCRRCRRLC